MFDSITFLIVTKVLYVYSWKNEKKTFSWEQGVMSSLHLCWENLCFIESLEKEFSDIFDLIFYFCYFIGKGRNSGKKKIDLNGKINGIISKRLEKMVHV